MASSVPGGAPRARALAVLCVASAAWAFGFGLSVPLGSLWLKDAGCSARTVGLSTSAYYLGLALTAPMLPWLMRRLGLRVVVAGMLLDGLTTALFPWVDHLVGWFALRLLGGAGTALSLIPMETLVNHNAPPQSRASDFGVYAFAVALGVGLGPLAGLPLYPIAPLLAFGLAGVISALAGLLVALGLSNELPESAAPEKSGGSFTWGPHAFSLGTGWVQGFLEGGMLTFLPAYLLGVGYTETGASGLMGAMFLGVVLFQLPGAWLADRLGRLRVLLTCHAVVLLGLVGLPRLQATSIIAPGLFAVGACCAALYPLGLALLGERTPPEGMAQANAWFLAFNGAGSLVGPWIIGLAIDGLGPRGMFSVSAVAVVLTVGCGLMWQGRARAATVPTETEPSQRRAA
jgi:MFS family permease